MSDSPVERTKQVLREHGLPEGLLPHSITEAEITDGAFVVRLQRTVERRHGPYRVRFSERISGQLSLGRVTALTGVKAKQGLWLSVGAITADGDALVFSVGPARRRLPRSAFP